MRKEHGSSLLYVILLTGIMLVVSFSVSVLSAREFATVGISQKSQQAFYAAEAGIERALYELEEDPNAIQPALEVDIDSATKYEYAYGDLEGGAGLDDIYAFELEENKTRRMYLYDPENLTEGPFDDVSNVNVERVGGPCPDGVLPAMEVTTISFNQGTVTSFDLAKLRDTDASFNAEDESKIRIEKRFFANADNATGDIPVAAPGYLYSVDVKAISCPGNFTMTFDDEFIPENTITIRSYGTAADQARRAIQVSLSRGRTALDIFNYVLFEDDPIEKEAL